MGKKVRNAKTEKVPYVAVIGDKEVSEKKVTLESRDKGKLGEFEISKFVSKLVEETKSRV